MVFALIDIAVLGFGVVGSGTVEVIERNSDRIVNNSGLGVKVKYILDIKEFPGSPYLSLFVNDFEKILNDSDVAVVVETIGGIEPALEYTRRCLKAGKSVVTSNKELVAEHGFELLALAGENGVNYLFEGSVGGGIPVIRPIAQCMAANRITEICGILNGTTNYILTEMEKNGTDFSDSLCAAQKMGYAETDPTADVKGHDTCRKICILASLAFGRHIYPSQVPTDGIDIVTHEDIHYASNLGYTIKLLGRARVQGEKISAYVAPHLTSKNTLMSDVGGVTNCVVVRGNAVGNVMFIGAGAGKMPTASAVAADVVDAAKHLHARKLINWAEGGQDIGADPTMLESSWYIRTNTSQEKILHRFGRILFAESDISSTETAFITSVMSAKTVKELLGKDISALTIFRVLGEH
jgi:homoserine dehydrogenase